MKAPGGVRQRAFAGGEETAGYRRDGEKQSRD